MILTVAIILVIGVVSISLSGGVFFQKNANAFFVLFQSTVRKAQVYTLMGQGGSSWGIAQNADVLVLFRGSSYATRDPAFDQSFPLPDNVTLTGFTEIVAARGSGAIGGTRTSLSLTGIGQSTPFRISREGAFQVE